MDHGSCKPIKTGFKQTGNPRNSWLLIWCAFFFSPLSRRCRFASRSLQTLSPSDLRITHWSGVSLSIEKKVTLSKVTLSKVSYAQLVLPYIQLFANSLATPVRNRLLHKADCPPLHWTLTAIEYVTLTSDCSYPNRNFWFSFHWARATSF